MPLYDYECSACEIVWEEQLTIENRNKPTEEACPECGTMNTVSKILMGAPGIGDPVRLGLRRPSEGHLDLLRNMKKKLDTPHSKTTINTW